MSLIVCGSVVHFSISRTDAFKFPAPLLVLTLPQIKDEQLRNRLSVNPILA